MAGSGRVVRGAGVGCLLGGRRDLQDQKTSEIHGDVVKLSDLNQMTCIGLMGFLVD